MVINCIMCTLKILTNLCFAKQRIKTKIVYKSCLQCFSSKNVLKKHQETCLNINGAQSVRLEKGTTEFENYLKQIPVPFKIYADFESNLKSIESYEGSYSKKNQDHIPCSFADKLVYADYESTKPLFVFRGEMLLIILLKQFLKSISIVEK